jgi:thioesterase domain-containing protein
VKKKVKGVLHKIAALLKPKTHPDAHLPRWNEVYWPGPSFVPKIYDGRITVFRVPKQSAVFIRNHALAWDKRSTRDVHVETIPGEHDTILREPWVETLASRLTEIIAAAEATLQKPSAELIRKGP